MTRSEKIAPEGPIEDYAGPSTLLGSANTGMHPPPALPSEVVGPAGLPR